MSSSWHDTSAIALLTTAASSFVAGYALSTIISRFNQPTSAIKVNPTEPKTPHPPPQSDSDEDEEDDEIGEDEDVEPHKMVLVVRMDLKMGKGKVCAQVGHATLGAYRRALKHNHQAVKDWSRGGQAKVALRINTEQEMLDLEKKASEEGLNTYIVMDAGRTQVASGSKTVLAIGPAPVQAIDKVTRHLKLL